MADYPSDHLPDFRLDGYGSQKTETNYKTEMDAGNEVVIRRFTEGTEIWQLSAVMTSYQLEIFEYWYHFEVNEGSEYSNIPIRDALGSTPQMVRLPEQYSKDAIDDDQWLIEVEGQVKDPRYISETEYNSRVNPHLQGDWLAADWLAADWKTT